MITLVWMGVEAVVSLAAAWVAHSPALLGFGGDSAVELFSAVIVWWRLSPRAGEEERERMAAKFAGALLLVLAGIVVLGALTAFAGRMAQPGTQQVAANPVASLPQCFLADRVLVIVP